jgi:hypothetical protein
MSAVSTQLRVDRDVHQRRCVKARFCSVGKIPESTNIRRPR